jgi:hypothetical protein
MTRIESLRQLSLFAVTVLIATLSLQLPVAAQAPRGTSTHRGMRCMGCHPEKKADYSNPNIKGTSVHSKESCFGCHPNIGPYPHKPHAAIRPCTGCHQEYDQAPHLNSVVRCSECHGIHGIRKVDDPLSPINPRRRQELCYRCHSESSERTPNLIFPTVGNAFSTFSVHEVVKGTLEHQILYWVNRFMQFLVVGVGGFFAVLTGMFLIRMICALFYRKILVRFPYNGHAHTPSETDRWLHFFSEASFLGLAGTGVLQMFPNQAQVQAATAVFFNDIQTLRLTHIVLGVIMMLSAAAVVAKGVLKVVDSRRMPSLEPVPGLGDVDGLVNWFVWFLGLGPRPNLHPWMFWEKLQYLGHWWGTFLMSVTGLLLWFPNFAQQVFPGWVYNAARIMHFWEAILATLVVFCAGTLNRYMTGLHPEIAHFKPGASPFTVITWQSVAAAIDVVGLVVSAGMIANLLRPLI